MVITYYGAGCFKVQSGETIVAISPPSKESKLKSPRFQTDVVLVNCNHPDYNGWENLSSKEENKTPFVANGPGEYEKGGMHIKGIPGGNLESFGQNTIYVFNLEDISVCHLGLFKEKKLTPEQQEEIGEVDILFVPLNGESQIITQLEPKIAIPMSFDEKELKQFLREFGENGTKPVEKLTIKKKDLGEEKSEVVVLTPVI